MPRTLQGIKSLLKNVILAAFFITISLMIIFFVPNLVSPKENPLSTQWIQGHVTAISKESISIEGVEYQFDPHVTVTDSRGNLCKISSLRNAHIVKILEKDGKAVKIVVIQLRE